MQVHQQHIIYSSCLLREVTLTRDHLSLSLNISSRVKKAVNLQHVITFWICHLAAQRVCAHRELCTHQLMHTMYDPNCVYFVWWYHGSKHWVTSVSCYSDSQYLCAAFIILTSGGSSWGTSRAPTAPPPHFSVPKTTYNQINYLTHSLLKKVYCPTCGVQNVLGITFKKIGPSANGDR